MFFHLYINLFQLSQGDINELCRSRSGSNSQRRCSNIEISPKTPRGSGSKVDLLKSTLEISHHQGKGHISNPALANSNRPSHHPYKVYILYYMKASLALKRLKKLILKIVLKILRSEIF